MYMEGTWDNVREVTWNVTYTKVENLKMYEKEWSD